jgi:hypothetical protein
VCRSAFVPQIFNFQLRGASKLRQNLKSSKVQKFYQIKEMDELWELVGGTTTTQPIIDPSSPITIRPNFDDLPSPMYGENGDNDDTQNNGENDDTQLEDIPHIRTPRQDDDDEMQPNQQSQPKPQEKQLVSSTSPKQITSSQSSQSSQDNKQVALIDGTISVEALTTGIVTTVMDELNRKLAPFYNQFNETRECLLTVKRMLEKQMNEEQPVVSVPSAPSGSRSGDRESIIVMFVIFFFGFSTNTATVTVKDTVLYLSIHNTILTVMKHTLITGTSAKSILAPLKLPSKRRSDKACADMISTFLSVGDLSVRGTKQVTVSFQLFMERCRKLYTDFTSDVTQLGGLFAAVDPDWLLNMGEVEDGPKPLAGKKPFKGTKNIPPLTDVLSIGHIPFSSYELLITSSYYDWRHGFFSYMSTGVLPNQNNPVVEGSFAKFTGFWCFETVVDELPEPVKKVSTRSSKKKKETQERQSTGGKAPRSSKKRKDVASDEEEDESNSRKKSDQGHRTKKQKKQSKQSVEDYNEHTDYGSDGD